MLTPQFSNSYHSRLFYSEEPDYFAITTHFTFIQIVAAVRDLTLEVMSDLSRHTEQGTRTKWKYFE